jgi:hypothetical protein
MPIRHILQAGECLQSLAWMRGFAAAKTIYDAPENAALRKKRSSPAAVTVGDEVFVPDPRKHEVSLPTGEVHRIVVKSPRAMVRIEVRDEAGEPLASKPYLLVIGGKKLEGTTTGEGVVEQPVPLDATDGTLIVHDKSSKDEGRWSWRLTIADLAAPETRRGVSQRLANLGYWGAGDPEDQDDATPAAVGEPAPRDPLVLALRAFQHDEKLDESGRLDDDTRARLVERHGI